MSYWVEYSDMNGIRENLMVDSITDARRKALNVCKGSRSKDADARIYSGPYSNNPVGEIFCSRMTKRWIWRSFDKWGIMRCNWYLDGSGRLKGTA